MSGITFIVRCTVITAIQTKCIFMDGGAVVPVSVGNNAIKSRSGAIVPILSEWPLSLRNMAAGIMMSDNDCLKGILLG